MKTKEELNELLRTSFRDEYFALSGQDRQRTENLAVSSKVVARKVEEADARKATSENLRKFVNGMEKVGTAAGELRYFIGHNGSELGSMLKSLTEADPKIDSKAIENILSNVYILSDNAVPADLIGLSTALRISIEKARVFPGKPPEGMNQKDWDAARETKRDKLAGDILSILKDNKRFAEVYGQHERLLDEHYQNSGKERKKMEDQAFSRNAALAGLA